MHLVHHLRLERVAVRRVLFDIGREIHGLSEDLDGDDTASGAEPFLGYVSDGPGDHREHDCIRVRAGLGWELVEACMGIVVD